MTDDNLSMMAEPSVDEVVPRWVARYLDLIALSRDKPVQVIGEQGLIFDKPGFEVEFVTAPSAPVSAEPHYTVLMPVRGFGGSIRMARTAISGQVIPRSCNPIPAMSWHRQCPVKLVYTGSGIQMTQPGQAGGKGTNL